MRQSQLVAKFLINAHLIEGLVKNCPNTRELRVPNVDIAIFTSFNVESA